MTAPADTTASAARAAPAADPKLVPTRSEFLLGWFTWYVRGYLRRNFHGVRLSRAGAASQATVPTGPLLIAVNHPSWWDPLIGLILSERFAPRRHFAPIEQAMLEKYSVFARLGFFGIEPDSTRGAITFLRTCEAICAAPDAAIWVTVQGHFADVRTRPIRIKAGLGHLARRLASQAGRREQPDEPAGCVLPLALEYVFWNERFPEALARFGEPLPLAGATARARSADEWTAAIEAGLTAAADGLADDAISRDASRFETLIGGAVGVGGVYDWWRRLRAWFRGERFRPEHQELGVRR